MHRVRLGEEKSQNTRVAREEATEKKHGTPKYPSMSLLHSKTVYFPISQSHWQSLEYEIRRIELAKTENKGHVIKTSSLYIR